jgi:hypothetical protein
MNIMPHVITKVNSYNRLKQKQFGWNASASGRGDGGL